MATEQQVKDELNACFNLAGHQQETEWFGRIGAYLSSGDVDSELQLLEHEGGKNSRLSDALLMVEHANNLNVVYHRTAPTLPNGVSSEQFAGLLKNLILVKDVGVKQDHGEFTHRIQWYLLIKKFEAYAGFNALRLLRVVADSVNLWTAGVNTDGYSIWTALFDRYESAPPRRFSADGPGDFRRPEYLHSYLMNAGSGGPCPKLSGFLAKRFTKRNDQTMRDYLVNKLYGREWPSYQALLDASKRDRTLEPKVQRVDALFASPELIEPPRPGETQWSSRPLPAVRIAGRP
jgi:hypothetical protein